MSTKSTISHGEKFHLFEEMCDDDFVYLRVEDADFTVHPGSVEVAIPLAIWEVIRKKTHQIMSSPYTGKTDAEVEEMARRSIESESPTTRDYYHRIFGETDIEPRIQDAILSAKAERDTVQSILDQVQKIEKPCSSS